RYIERNPLRASLVLRAEMWPWSSLSDSRLNRNTPALSKPPIELPAYLVERVNMPPTPEELEAIRQAVETGAPYGDRNWREVADSLIGWRQQGRTKRGTTPFVSGAPFRQRTRHIFGDAAPGDVREAFDEIALDERPHGAQVRTVRREQRVGDRRAKLGDERVGPQAAGVEQDPAGKGIAVGVKTGGRETDQSIARHDRPPIDDALAVDNADDEAGEVVFAVGVEA